MDFYRVEFIFNYCGGDTSVVVTSEKDLEEDSHFSAFCEEVIGDMAYESFGCMIGDTLPQNDEEEEELEGYVHINLIEFDELTDWDQVVCEKDFYTMEWDR